MSVGQKVIDDNMIGLWCIIKDAIIQEVSVTSVIRSDVRPQCEPRAVSSAALCENKQSTV